MHREAQPKETIVRKCLAIFLAIIILAIVPAFFCLAQQKAPAANPAGASTGKEYVSTKLAPGTWHIEDTVHATYRNSMYLVAGTEKAALIDPAWDRAISQAISKRSQSSR
jgi:hypothetical protein